MWLEVTGLIYADVPDECVDYVDLGGSIFVWFYSLLLFLGKNSETCDVLQELQIFSMRLEEVAMRIPIPREVYLILWESIIRLTCSTFVEGWARGQF